MKKLLMVAAFLFPVAAQAAPIRAILPFAPVKSQIASAATQAGFTLGKGEKLSIRTLSKGSFNKPGEVEAKILSKFSIVPGGPVGEHVIATAKFKTNNVVDGTIATGVKQEGQVWQRLLFAEQAGK